MNKIKPAPNFPPISLNKGAIKRSPDIEDFNLFRVKVLPRSPTLFNIPEAIKEESESESKSELKQQPEKIIFEIPRESTPVCENPVINFCNII